MTRLVIHGKILCGGEVRAPVLRLDEPLSFWGGYDPQTGTIIDTHHPQQGRSVTGNIMMLPASRGSAGTPAGIAESLRIGIGPAGVITKQADINILAGLLTAARLYETAVPLVVVSDADYDRLRDVAALEISKLGQITPIV